MDCHTSSFGCCFLFVCLFFSFDELLYVYSEAICCLFLFVYSCEFMICGVILSKFGHSCTSSTVFLQSAAFKQIQLVPVNLPQLILTKEQRSKSKLPSSCLTSSSCARGAKATHLQEFTGNRNSCERNCYPKMIRFVTSYWKRLIRAYVLQLL